MKKRVKRMLAAGAAGLLLLTITVRAAVVEMDVGQLTAESNRIIIGDVVDITSFWNQDHTLIKSRIVVEVDNYLYGRGGGMEIMEMSGGTVGDLSLQVSVLPTFEIDDHVLLFLGQSEIGLVGSFQGAYLTDGHQIARMAPGCRQIFSETLMDLPDFLELIRESLPEGTSLPEITPYTGEFEFPTGIPLYALCGRDWTYKPNPMGEDYVINGNCGDGPAGDAGSQRTQVQNAANAWNGAGADFEFTYGGASNVTAVQYDYINLVYFDTTPPDGGGYVAATYSWFTGGNITECDLVYNDLNYTWWNGSGGCSYYMDIWNVGAHEFGHMLCLDHSSLYYATMYAYVDYCETYKRSLFYDDVDGIVAIYGYSTVDEDPPEPDPMTFENPPHYNGMTSITMTATEATDVSPPVEYEFDFYSGGPGGTDRGYGTSRIYTDFGLTPNTEYSYRCRARDDASPPNETQYSTIESASTLARTPGAPTITNVTTTTMDVDVDPADNPDYTNFAILCTTADAAWNNKFVDASGNPGDAATWQTDDDWGAVTVQGLTPNTEYSFQVKGINEDGIETDYGPQSSETTLPDTDEIPPEPNPMTFEVAPEAEGTASITMTATLASDDTPPIYYEFDFYSGGPGGSDRPYNTTRTFLDTGLEPNTEYSYRCRARDDVSPPNETDYSTVESAYTLAEIPGAPTITNVTTTTMDVDVDPAGNPAYTYFAILCTTADAAWNNKFVDAAGNPVDTEVWQTDADWGAITVQGLTPETEYSFQVKGINEAGIETDYGPQSTETTLPPQQEVPTISEWGMIIFSLSLLALGTIAIVRRRLEAPAN
jgi:hypothetical protein